MLDFVKAHPAALAIPQRGAPSGLTPDLGAA
jgi:hypothetical protein